jgi:hypothetical protein
MEALMKTANFGIGSFLAAKETVTNTVSVAGEKLDDVIAKGAAEQGELAENSRKLVTDLSNGVAEVQGKIEGFVSDVQAQLNK